MVLIHRSPQPGSHYVRVNLGRRNIFVSEQLLNGPDVIAGFQKARGETVTQRMATGGLRDASQPYRLFQRPLQTGLAGMVTAHLSRPRVSAQMARWEDILPSPFSGRLRIFSSQGVR